MDSSKFFWFTVIMGVLVVGGVGYAAGPAVVDDVIGVYNFPWFNATVGTYSPRVIGDEYFLGTDNVTDHLTASLVEDVSFTVYKEGSTYYAKSGTDGSIAYSGASSYTVTQSVFDALSSGGKVLIKAGTTIQIGANTLQEHYGAVVIEGEGWESVIQLNNVNSAFIVGNASNTREGIVLRDLYIKGHGTNTNAMLEILNAVDCKVEDCKFNYQPNGAGIEIDAGSGGGIGIELLHNRITAVGKGIHVTSSGTYSVRSLEVIGGRIHNIGAGADAGIYVEQGSATGTHDSGIIMGTNFHDNPVDVNATHSRGWRVIGTRHEDSTTCFDITGDHDWKFYGIVFLTGITNYIENPGSDVDIRDCENYRTEWTGTATIPNGATDISVAHGCSFTPTTQDCQVTPTNNLGNAAEFWISAVNSTKITIAVNADPGAGTATFVWKVERVK